MKNPHESWYRQQPIFLRTPLLAAALLVQADVAWIKVETARFDPVLFGFDAGRRERLKEGIVLERVRLDELRATLEAGDSQAWIARAPGLKGGFSRVFMLFGNFEGLEAK